MEMDKREKKPMEMDEKSGEIPVIPALKPIVKQFSAKINPKKKDSFTPMDFISVAVFKGEFRFFSSFSASCVKGDDVAIHHKPRPMIKIPPTKLAIDDGK